LFLEEFDQGGTNLFLKLYDITETLVLQAVGVQFPEQAVGSFFTHNLTVALDESEGRDLLFL